MTQQTDYEKIRRIITRGKYGSVYFAQSFRGFNAEYTSKLLAAFEKEGLLVRISKGVYLKARHTRFGIAYPPIDDIVHEIARRDKALVIPTGETAANLLGLSEQVPTHTSFLTTGTYRTLQIGQRSVLLKNAAPRNFQYHNPLLGTLVQALRSIGQSNVTEAHLQRIAQLLSGVTPDHQFHKDLLLAPVWIQNIITQTLKNSGK